MLKSLFYRSTTYSLLVTVSNKMGWSDQSSVFTFRTRQSGLVYRLAFVCHLLTSFLFLQITPLTTQDILVRIGI